MWSDCPLEINTISVHFTFRGWDQTKIIEISPITLTKRRKSEKGSYLVEINKDHLVFEKIQFSCEFK